MWACGNPVKSLWRRISLEFLVEVRTCASRVFAVPEMESER